MYSTLLVVLLVLLLLVVYTVTLYHVGCRSKYDEETLCGAKAPPAIPRWALRSTTSSAQLTTEMGYYNNQS